MNRTTLLGSPLLLGFEHLERLLERSQKAATEGYPPYNIEELRGESADSGGRLRITLAVAGFAPEELSVTVEDNQLVIRGKQSDADDKMFLHRGIAARQFLRSFVLADGIEVTSAALENGLLKIDLARPKAETTIQTIEIQTGGIS